VVEKVNVHVYVTVEIWKKAIKFSKNQGWTKSYLVEQALKALVEGKQVKENPVLVNTGDSYKVKGKKYTRVKTKTGRSAIRIDDDLSEEG